MTVLVTGADGDLGSELIKELSAQSIDYLPVTRNQCDLTKAGQVSDYLISNQPDLIVHCAAVVPAKAAEYHQSDAVAENSVMLKNILGVCHCPVLFISSMTVYGTEGPVVRREDYPVAAESAYGQSKVACENMLRSSQTSSLILRIPGLFGGSRQSGLIYNAITSLNSGRKPQLPDSPVLWAAMDVTDAARYLVNIIKTYQFEAGCSIWNIGYEEVYSINKLVGYLEQLFNVTIDYEVQHPMFAFNLDRLKKSTGLPDVDLFTAIKSFRDRVC